MLVNAIDLQLNWVARLLALDPCDYTRVGRGNMNLEAARAGGGDHGFVAGQVEHPGDSFLECVVHNFRAGPVKARPTECLEPTDSESSAATLIVFMFIPRLSATWS